MPWWYSWKLKLFSQAIVAIDGGKFKAVNSRDRNVTPNKVDRRQEQIEQSIQRYLDAQDDEYQCPAGERAIHRFATVEKGLGLQNSPAAKQCLLARTRCGLASPIEANDMAPTKRPAGTEPGALAVGELGRRLLRATGLIRRLEGGLMPDERLKPLH